MWKSTFRLKWYKLNTQFLMLHVLSVTIWKRKVVYKSKSQFRMYFFLNEIEYYTYFSLQFRGKYSFAYMKIDELGIFWFSTKFSILVIWKHYVFLYRKSMTQNWKTTWRNMGIFVNVVQSILQFNLGLIGKS